MLLIIMCDFAKLLERFEFLSLGFNFPCACRHIGSWNSLCSTACTPTLNFPRAGKLLTPRSIYPVLKRHTLKGNCREHSSKNRFADSSFKGRNCKQLRRLRGKLVQSLTVREKKELKESHATILGRDLVRMARTHEGDRRTKFKGMTTEELSPEEQKPKHRGQKRVSGSIIRRLAAHYKQMELL